MHRQRRREFTALPSYHVLTSEESPATFALSSQEHTNASMPAPLIVLRLKVSDPATTAGDNINEVSEAVRPSKGDLYDVVGELVSKLDVFVRAIGALSEVSHLRSTNM